VHVIGQLATAEGLTCWPDEVAVIPASEYRDIQPSVPLCIDHDWQVGEVTRLERSAKLGLVCMAEVNDDMRSTLEDGSWWMSAGVTGRQERSDDVLGRYHHVTLNEVSLVRSTAAVATGRVHVGLGSRCPSAMPMAWDDTWRRGVSTYRRSDLMLVHDLDPPAPPAVADQTLVRIRAASTGTNVPGGQGVRWFGRELNAADSALVREWMADPDWDWIGAPLPRPA
jgi:hypothetical protein